MKLITYLSVSLLCSGFVCAQAFAHTVQPNAFTVVGRYLTVSNKPLIAQQDLMQQTFQVRFPKNVETVGQAMDYLLQYSGYRLKALKTMSTTVQQMLQLPLPMVDRDFGPMTLKVGLETLAGSSYQLLIDRVHRRVAFKQKTGHHQVIYRGRK